jgi:hypothetical protein
MINKIITSRVQFSLFSDVIYVNRTNKKYLFQENDRIYLYPMLMTDTSI